MQPTMEAFVSHMRGHRLSAWFYIIHKLNIFPKSIKHSVAHPAITSGSSLSSIIKLLCWILALLEGIVQKWISNLWGDSLLLGRLCFVVTSHNTQQTVKLQSLFLDRLTIQTLSAKSRLLSDCSRICQGALETLHMLIPVVSQIKKASFLRLSL